MEALKTIISAWAVAFIFIFVGLLGNGPAKNNPDYYLYTEVMMYLTIPVVTGTGWLVYRSKISK